MTDLLSQSFRLPDGRTLMVAEYGAPTGKPVFYFHGLAGSRLEPIVLGDEAFSKAGIRLIAPDRPGMGGSTFQPGRGFRHWVADLLTLAGKLGLDNFGVWGVSGGSGYAAACARWIPDRLSAVVIVSGAGDMTSSVARASLPAINRWMWKASRSERLMSLFLQLSKALQGDPVKMRQQMMRNMPPVERAFFETPGRLDAFIASGMESMRQGVRGVAWDTHLYAIPWDFHLEEICFPVCLLHGEKDQNVPVAVARQVAAAIPGCQASYYSGEGHISILANHLGEINRLLTAKA